MAMSDRPTEAPMADPQSSTPGGTGNERLVRGLALVVFLQWFGASAIIPLLPEYVRHHGGSDALAGVVMASFFAAGVVSQYPAGRLADRIGRRPVLLGGLALYGLASLAFLAPVPPGIDIAFRALQGVGAGGAEVAALAMVSAAVLPERRGAAFATVYSGQVAGMAIGPLLGSVLGVDLMWIVFLGAGVASFAACLAAWRVPDHPAAAPASIAEPRSRPRRTPALTGSLVAAVVLGLTFGTYEICWTLLLISRGAAQWQVGLSWTLFCVPFVLASKPSGWLTDHVDRRVLVLGGLTLSAVMCATYPFLASVPLLVGLGALEAMGVALVLPAAQSLLVQTAGSTEFGRVQGMFSTSQTGAQALAAAVGGFLFGVARWAPFTLAGSIGLVLVVVIATVWRSVAGRVVPARPHSAGAVVTGVSVEVQ